MKYHAYKVYRVVQDGTGGSAEYKTYCGRRFSWFADRFVYDREAFLKHHDHDARCKKCLASIMREK